MKTYTRVIIDMVTGRTVEEEWYHHDGPVALCKGPTPPQLPKPPKPPPIPEPPDLELTEEKKRQQYLDQMLYRMRQGRASTLTASRHSSTFGQRTIMTDQPGPIQGMRPVSTVLGGSVGAVGR